jgi:acyl carrier protein
MSARGVVNTPTSVDEVQPARREVEFTPPAFSATVSPEPNYAVDSLTKALLIVVSEKTGYPVEMLDLNTDMEADLGIDSIKRVEIMGAMRTQFPNLPKVDAEAFAEVRTLGQIVTYMGGSRTAEVSQPALEAQISPPAPAAPIPQAVISPLTGEKLTADTLTSALLTVVSEKTGYPVEMLDLNTDMEADLGIDSIKRVEIMGALRSQFPNLPKVDAEAFADVRTLGQIVAYLSRDGSAEKKGLESRVEAGASFPDLAIPRGIVNLKSLPWPDFQNFALPENSICLVTDDGTATTTILVEKLLSRSWKVVVLNFPAALVSSKASLPDGIHRVTLEDLSEQNLQEKLAEISQKFGPISALVHLNPVYQASRTDEIFSNSEKEIIKHVFLLAKHLKGSLTSAARNGKAFFMIVVHMDGEFGLGNEIDFDPISGGLFGLVKTLNLEWGAVYCRAVDISPDYAGVDVARRVVAEIFDPNLLLTEVGYSLRGRTTLVVGQAVEEEGIQ